MCDRRSRIQRGVHALYRRAIRVPLPNVAAERAHHENMARIADSCDYHADLLADSTVSAIEACDVQMEGWREGFEYRLDRLVGDDYGRVAASYIAGERDDWIGELAVYYRECLLRIEERTGLTDQTCVLLVLRYPDSFTVNFRFERDELPSGGVRFESSEHATDPPAAYREEYYADCQYSQYEAADYFREGADVIRREMPDPADATADERAYGGFVYATGRKGSVFANVIEPVEPDPDRFTEPATEPGIVPEGPEAEDVCRRLFTDGEALA